MKLETNQKLVMIGDSITDCGRKHPVGEAPFEGLGKGYVALVEAHLRSSYPERNLRVVNVGTSGNTVRDLAARWAQDVFAQKPDWLSVNIGINDVWRQFDWPYMGEAAVHIDEYRETLRDLVAQTRPRVKGLVLMSPHYLEPNRQDSMRAAMDQYGAIVREAAADFDCIFVDTQAAFDKVLAHLYPGTVAWDRVHPNLAGHMVIARAFLNAIGFDWSR